MKRDELKEVMWWFHLQLWNSLGGAVIWTYAAYLKGGYMRPSCAIIMLIWAIVIYRNLRRARTQRDLEWVGKIMDS